MITLPQLKAEVIRLAEENPDFIYDPEDTMDNCRYLSGPNGGCIMGQALTNLGLPAHVLETHDKTFDSINAVLITLCIKGMVESPTNFSKAFGWFTSVQSAQDVNIPWGKAVSAAVALEEKEASLL